MKKALLPLLAVVVLIGAVKFRPTQVEIKPLATVSLANYDKLMANIGLIGRLSGNPGAKTGLEFMLQMITQGKGLAGLDKTLPWGAVILAEDPRQLTFCGFIPVANLEQLVEVAKSAPQLADAIKFNNGVYEIHVKDQTIYAQQKGKWTFIGTDRKQLAAMPADPLKLLGEMPKNYDLAIRGSMKNAPWQYREELLTVLRGMFEIGHAELPDQSEEQYELRARAAKRSAKLSFERLSDFVNGLEDVTLGWNVNPSTRTTHLDFELTSQSGSKLADQLRWKPRQSDFADFIMPQAALSANWVYMLSDADVAQANSRLATLHKSVLTKLQNDGLSKEEVKLASRLVDDVFDVIEKTRETKLKDGGLTVLLAPDSATVVVGAAVVDGEKLQKVLQRLVDELRNTDPETAKTIKLDAETYEGVRFNTISIPTPKAELIPFVGDTLEVVVGIADGKVILAAGRDAAGTLKKVIHQSNADSGEEVSPIRISFAATAIAKFIAEVGDTDQVKTRAAALADTLEQTGGKDHVSITINPIARGIRVRLELEEGIFQALVSMVDIMALMNEMIPTTSP